MLAALPAAARVTAAYVLSEENTASETWDATETTEATEATEAEPKISKSLAKAYIVYLVSTLYNQYYYNDVTEADYLYAALTQTIDDEYFDLDRSIKAMVENMDEYSAFFPAETFTEVIDNVRGEFSGAGIVMSKSIDDVMVMEVYADSPADQAGIKVGDIIKYADGQLLTGMALSDVRNIITGEKGTTVSLQVLRGEQMLDFTIIRGEVSVSSIENEICGDGEIGYIKLTSFTLSLEEFLKPVLDDFDKRGITKLILDLRGNHGGEVGAAQMLAELLLPEGVLTKVHYKDSSLNSDLKYTNNITTPKYDLVVLTDNYSASASEMFAGCVKARKLGTIIGEETFGKGSMQSIFRTITGSGIKFTFAEFYTPNDERIHTVGIQPDIHAEMEYTLPDAENFEDIDFERIGSTENGKGVYAMEQRLAVLGIFDGAPDEVWDEDTAQAIGKFQSYMNYAITSRPNLETLIALNDIDYTFYIEVDTPKQQAINYLMGK